MQKERKTITLYLDDFVEDYLGTSFCREIRPYIAELIEVGYKGKLLYHVQWADRYSPDLKMPILWRYKAWVESVDRWEKAKKASHDRVVAHNIMTENVKRLADDIETDFKLDRETSERIASHLLRKNKHQQINHIGTRIITREDEL